MSAVSPISLSTTARGAAAGVAPPARAAWVGGNLPVCAGAARNDPARGLDLCPAIKAIGIVAHHSDDLLQQIPVGDDGALAEINQPFIQAIALGAPAVFRDQHSGISPPALVLGARALDHPAQTLEDGGDTDGIVEKRAHIGDAHPRSARPAP
jgi:hypothetical protein